MGERDIGLALSGGGFRATLFHLGGLTRLNELGLLPRLAEVTSVSGGSITAAVLGLAWKELGFDPVSGVARNFERVVAQPLRTYCGRTVDAPAIVLGLLCPFLHPGQLFARSLRRLVGEATLQQLPADAEGPRFTFYATSLQTGASVRFSMAYLAEYHLGQILTPEIPLARVVAASAAFPPVLCPVTLDLEPGRWQHVPGADLHGDVALKSRLLLGDGGIYDNLGLERLLRKEEDPATHQPRPLQLKYPVSLVSDAGAPFALKHYPWSITTCLLGRTLRTLGILAEQDRAQRVRLFFDLLHRAGQAAYWGIASAAAGYGLEQHRLPGPLLADSDRTAALARLRTRLNRFRPEEQTRLLDWGYALADTALRRYLPALAQAPGELPYPW